MNSAATKSNILERRRKNVKPVHFQWSFPGQSSLCFQIKICELFSVILMFFNEAITFDMKPQNIIC